MGPAGQRKGRARCQPEPTAKDNELTAWPTPAVRPQPATKTEPAGMQTGRPQTSRRVGPASGGESADAAAGGPKMLGRRRIKAGLVSFVLVGLVAGSLGVVAATHLDRSPSKVTPPSAAVLRQEAVNGRQTAAWVAEQVSHEVSPCHVTR